MSGISPTFIPEIINTLTAIVWLSTQSVHKEKQLLRFYILVATLAIQKPMQRHVKKVYQSLQPGQ